MELSTPPQTPTGTANTLDYVSQQVEDSTTNTPLAKSSVDGALSISPSTGSENSQAENALSTPQTSTPEKGTQNHPTNNEDTGILEFPYWITDYDLPTDKKARQQHLLGAGQWSNVYLASTLAPSSPSSSPTSNSTFPAGDTRKSDIGLPTPRTSLDVDSTKPLTTREAYAIKLPYGRTAKTVLATEVEILSGIATRYPDYASYVVPFFGRDERNEAIVLEAMDTTLEAYVQNHLNTLGKEERQKALAKMFVPIAKSLLEGLVWMGERGIVHGDIKPGNILISLQHLEEDVSDIPIPNRILYTDFSAATLPSMTKEKNPGAGAAGTWDFLSPVLITTKNAPSTASTDLWALAITLLQIVIGASPFDSAARGNNFRRREFIKMGNPLGMLRAGEDGLRNAACLDASGLEAWFKKVLGNKGRSMVTAKEWLQELKGLSGGGQNA